MVWSKDDESTPKINEKIMNLIGVDCQPFSIVMDQGFKELVAHLETRYVLPFMEYFENTVLPSTYKSLRSRIAIELKDAKFVSVT